MAAPTGSATLGAHNLFDTALAAAMIVVAAGFLVFMQIRTGTGRLTSYDLEGRIPNAAGLRVGSDVRLGGVKIGRIVNLSVDSHTYQAVIAMQIRDDLTLPQDSYLTLTSPVVGDMYLTAVPGHSNEVVKPNGKLLFGKASKPAARNPPSS